VSTLQTTNLKNEAYTGGAYNIQMASNGDVALANGLTTVGAAVIGNGLAVGVSLTPPHSFYMKNRLINGGFNVAQRATASTTIANSLTVPTYNTGYTTVDRWFTAASGGTPTSSQTTNATTGEKQLTITGATGVTNVYVGQRIEAVNCFDFAGQTITLSFSALTTSASSTLSYELSYASTYNDTFGTLATPTKTTISPLSPATGSVTLTGVLTRFDVSFAVPSAATTGLQILFTLPSLTANTLVLQNAQLEVGPEATPFERRSFNQELQLCQRYYEKSFPYNTAAAQNAGRQGAVRLPQLTALSTAQNTIAQFPFVVSKRNMPVSVTFTAATTVLTVSAISYGNLAPGVYLSGGGLAAGTYNISQTSGTTGGVGVYAVNTTNTIAVSATATGQSSPTMTFFNPDAANAQSRNISANVDNTLTLPSFVAENGFGFTFTNGAGTAVNQVIMVHFTAETEIS